MKIGNREKKHHTHKSYFVTIVGHYYYGVILKVFNVGILPSKKIVLFAFIVFNDDEKCFLFYYKSWPRSQDI